MTSIVICWLRSKQCLVNTWCVDVWEYKWLFLCGCLNMPGGRRWSRLFKRFWFNIQITSIPSFWRSGLDLRRKPAECRHQRIGEAQCQGRSYAPQPHDDDHTPPPRWTLQSWTMGPTWLVFSEWTKPFWDLLTLLWRKWDVLKERKNAITDGGSTVTHSKAMSGWTPSTGRVQTTLIES